MDSSFFQLDMNGDGEVNIMDDVLVMAMMKAQQEMLEFEEDRKPEKTEEPEYEDEPVLKENQHSAKQPQAGAKAEEKKPEKSQINLQPFFKSIIDQDPEPVVICDLQHVIIYMNPAAVRNYAKRGGASLVGRNLLACHNADSAAKIHQVLHWFEKSTENNRIHTFFNEKKNADVYMVALRDETGALIGYYEKHESRAYDESGDYQFT